MLVKEKENELKEKDLLVKEKENELKEKDLLVKEIIQEKDLLEKGFVQEKEDVSLYRLIKEGLPPLYRSFASASSKSAKASASEGESKPRKHDPASCTPGMFAILPEIVYNTSAGFSFIYHKSSLKNQKVVYSSESMVQEHVMDVLQDILQISGLVKSVTLIKEIETGRQIPDIWVLLDSNGLPICICEVKMPTKGILADPVVLGQVFDYMVMLRAMYGLRDVFAIITTYTEWIIGCLPDTSERAASLNEKPHFSENSGIDDLNALEKCRTMNVSDIFRYSDVNLIPNLVSLLRKCLHARFSPVKLFSNQRKYYRLCETTKAKEDMTETIFEKFPSSLKAFTLVPPTEKTKLFFILRQFHSGGDGEVVLACSAGGNLCVIKFNFDPDKALQEVELWKTLYNVNTVFVKNFGRDGRQAIVMPFAFHFQEGNTSFDFDLQLQLWSKYPNTMDRDEVVPLVEEEIGSDSGLRLALNSLDKNKVASMAIQTIAGKGYKHEDVHWRHVAVVPVFNKDSNGTLNWDDILKPVLIDLSRVSKCEDTRSSEKQMLASLEKEESQTS